MSWAINMGIVSLSGLILHDLNDVIMVSKLFLGYCFREFAICPGNCIWEKANFYKWNRNLLR